MIGKELFIGAEAEGERKGTLTLFIPKGSMKSCNFQNVLNKVNKLHVKRFYFGAGDETGITKSELDFINFLRLEVPFAEILIECTLEDLKSGLIKVIENRVDLILTIKDADLLSSVHYLKFVNNERLYWHIIKSVHVTELNDEEYNNDFKIEAL